MQQILLRETQSEYLLFLPFHLKERAKTIEGWHWDQQRKCWVYPRTPRNFDALVGEFGDDLVSVDITRPAVKATASLRPLIADVDALRAELAKYQDLVLSLRHAGGSQTGDRLKETLVQLEGRERELGDTKAILTGTTAVCERQERQITALEQQLATAQEQARLGAGARTADLLHRHLKQIAKDATGDSEFGAFVDRLTLDVSAPVEIAKHLENTLRQLLDQSDRAASLADLIAQARDEEILDGQAAHLAHQIRWQRNVLAHENIDRRTHTARVYFVLFAAAVLWPLLPE